MNADADELIEFADNHLNQENVNEIVEERVAEHQR